MSSEGRRQKPSDEFAEGCVRTWLSISCKRKTSYFFQFYPIQIEGLLYSATISALLGFWDFCLMGKHFEFCCKFLLCKISLR